MSSATEFVQATVRKSLTGAAVGAGVGAGVGVLVQFASSKKAIKKADASEAGQKGGGDRAGGEKTEPDKDRYPDLYAEAEVYWLVECMKEF